MRGAVLGTFLFLLSLLAGDWLLARTQADVFSKRTGAEDFLTALESRIPVGLPREQVELQLVGFGEREIVQERDGYIVGYGYWFGFLPPLSKSGMKYVGEVIVSYSVDDRVQSSSYWYN